MNKMKSKDKITMGVRVNKHLYERIKQLARVKSCSMGAILRQAMIEKLEREDSGK